MNIPSFHTFFHHFPLLQHLTPAEREHLDAVAQWRQVRKNSAVYSVGDAADQIFFLIRGGVKTGITLPDGRSMSRSIELPGALFGEAGLIGDTRRGDFARSLNQPVEFFAVRVSDFQQLMQQNFDLTHAILTFFGDRLRRAERQRQALVNKDVRSRIVDFIKENAVLRHPQAGLERLSLHGLTQGDIAHLVGASRQTVTAVLNDLRKMNLIHFNRANISIRDRDNLN